MSTTPTPQTSVQVAATTTPPAEVTINNTAAEILASHTAEKEAQVTPTVVAPPAAAPAEVKPYTVTKNQDGSVNVDFQEGGEKFTGTYEEVLDKISASKAEGNRYIKELKTPATPTTTSTPVATPQGWVPDETTSLSALNNMLTSGNYGDAIGIGLTQFFGGNDPNQVRQAIGELLQLSAELKGQKVISEFAQKAPDFAWAEANTELLKKELNSHNLPFTVENMVFAHNALKGMGVYVAAPTTPATQGTPNPAPPNGSTVAPSSGDYNPWTVPLKELEANIRAGR
jgi:hypothetical protein